MLMRSRTGVGNTVQDTTKNVGDGAKKTTGGNTGGSTGSSAGTANHLGLSD